MYLSMSNPVFSTSSLVSLTAANVNALLSLVIDQTRDVPEFRLSGDERMKLSSLLFAEAPNFVRAVGSALSREPVLFTRLKVSDKQLGATQARATAFHRMSAFFHELGDWTGDLALWDQADAIRTAMNVVRQVRGEAALPVPPDGTEDRQVALMPAEKVLTDRQTHKVRVARRMKRMDERQKEALAAIHAMPHSAVAMPHSAAPVAAMPHAAAPAFAEAGASPSTPATAGARQKGQKPRKPIQCPFERRELDALINGICRPRRPRRPNPPDGSSGGPSSSDATRPGPGTTDGQTRGASTDATRPGPGPTDDQARGASSDATRPGPGPTDGQARGASSDATRPGPGPADGQARGASPDAARPGPDRLRAEDRPSPDRPVADRSSGEDRPSSDRPVADRSNGEDRPGPDRPARSGPDRPRRFRGGPH